MRFPMDAIRMLTLASGMFLAMGVAQAQTVRYVDDDGDPGNGCASWADACPELQTALSLVIAGDQIWVAAGTYKPDYDAGTGQHAGDRTASFQLLSGIALYGGFDGTEATLEERAGLFDQTVLTGDLIGDDGPEFMDNGDNAYHVVTGSGTDQTTLLDGFTITAGNANGLGGPPPLDDRGGGMYNFPDGSPTVVNCTFARNSAAHAAGMYINGGSPTVTACVFIENRSTAFHGGGVAINHQAYPVLTNCRFIGNSVAGSGGGVYVLNTTPVLIDCLFLDNSAGFEGGGMYNSGTAVSVTNSTFSGNWAVDGGGMYNSFVGPGLAVTNCTFSGNHADDNGGGIFNKSSSPLVTNCRFDGNVADGGGGGIFNSNNANPKVTNSTFSENRAEFGGGMYNAPGSALVTNCTFTSNTAFTSGSAIFNEEYGSPTIANSILWQPESDQISGGSPMVLYSDVQGGWSGDGMNNIDTDPLFVDSGNGDLRLSAGSPCVDSADNTAVPPDDADLDGDGETEEPVPLDLDGQPRFVDDPSAEDCPQAPGSCGDVPVVDMGAFEFQNDCNENGISDEFEIYEIDPSDPAALNNDAPNDEEGFPGSGWDREPKIATDREGTWITVWTASNTLPVLVSDIHLARSTDNGLSWTDPMVLNGEPSSAANDSPSLSTDGDGTWLVVWTSDDDLEGTIGDDNDILFSASSDSGLTWTPPAPLNTDASKDGEAPDVHPSLATDESGIWIVAWNGVRLSRSTDNGATWSDTFTIGTGNEPHLSTDGLGVWVVVWTSIDDLGGTIGSDSDILFSVSTDDGVNWSDPAALNSAASEDTWQDHDSHPRITTDGAGNWVAVWTLRPFEPFRWDVYTSHSADHGQTWSPQRWLTPESDQKFDFNKNPQVGTDRNGNWVIVWSSNSFSLGLVDDILYSRSIDNGANWSVPELFHAVDWETDRYPHLATDLAGTWLVAWVSTDNLDGSIGNDRDILASRFELTAIDCNENEIPDSCDIDEGASTDCNGNGTADECEPDCNNNGKADPCDLADGTSSDCNGNEIPDECEPDCNANGQPDECDIAFGFSEDCNGDGVPDDCNEFPPITLHPEDQEAEIGGFVFFQIQAEGPVLEYQWRKDGENVLESERVLGTQSSNLFILQVIADDSGEYDCVVTDFLTGCSAVSDSATLTVILPPTIPLMLDIKPGACPNPFNRHGNGVLPVALVGTVEFDPAEVDLSTLQLSRADGIGGSVGPNEGPPGPHSMIRDAARPFDEEPCDCQHHGPDGIDDLSMRFRTDEMVEALELDALPGGAVVELILSGSLLDGTPFAASDCIAILPPGDTSPTNAQVESNVADTFVEVTPLDLNFDDDGFADFSRSYYGGTAMTLTAPPQSAGRRFVRWMVDGVPQPLGMRTIEVIVSEDTTLKAAYARPARPTPEHPTESDDPLE